MKSYDASVLISIMDSYNVDINKAYEVYNKISRKERAELRRKYINEETNEYIKAEKIKRYNEEMEILKKWENDFNYFINVKMIEYFKKHNVDYSEHILQII